MCPFLLKTRVQNNIKEKLLTAVFCIPLQNFLYNRTYQRGKRYDRKLLLQPVANIENFYSYFFCVYFRKHGAKVTGNQ